MTSRGQLRAVEEDGGDGGKTLSQFIKWANESGVPGHPAQDYNDIDIITWWTGGARMSMVSPQLPMVSAHPPVLEGSRSLYQGVAKAEASGHSAVLTITDPHALVACGCRATWR